jgi:hypothetical protein
MDLRAILPLSGLAFIFLWIYHSIRENWRRPWRIARERFAAAFMDEIQNLSQGKGDAFEFLRDAIPRHERAYRQYRSFLKGKSRQQFDEAWRDYLGDSQGNLQLFREQYFAAGNIFLAQEKRHLALKRIRSLLSFTQT